MNDQISEATPGSTYPSTLAKKLAPLRFVVFDGLGWCGAGFVAYGFISSWSGQTWAPLELVALPLSSTLTVLGTALTAASIYSGPHRVLPAWRTSKAFVAPVVILASLLCVLGIFGLFPFEITQITVNGFALLGLAGALIRMAPRIDPHSGEKT
jgi:hypothetical protein